MPSNPRVVPDCEQPEALALADGCFHGFCLVCLAQWAEVSRTCPLCKTPFTSIIHDIVSSSDYATLRLDPLEAKLSSDRLPWTPDHARRAAMYRPGTARHPRVDALLASRDTSRLESSTTPSRAESLRRRPFVAREVAAVLGPTRSQDEVDVVLGAVEAVLDSVPLSQPVAAIDLLAPLLGTAKATRFIDELSAFCLVRFDLAAYDRILAAVAKSPS
ncbi:uncharacterized protein AMSG_08332 [Thecamonas trahens ATCC 50062]|uniref:RING-type E3 ubiquitin transferase n=1 Tax=Thecamonas trahens ATCC 50062 TaxID=461836 RepID=A0A0L0DIY3_THETB|nr:hypothetical protein AMSG_08332 [Thecamonas trahens ATCC 50062]KNC52359.1 hypothetical protein AMSG_08332 [Thecamonas trahens ATCC 50062]|eukprot:XP_013755408.1 hypothetical protein AMSG_08332 [Thecamonas trahens ATCC 50062]